MKLWGNSSSCSRLTTAGELPAVRQVLNGETRFGLDTNWKAEVEATVKTNRQMTTSIDCKTAVETRANELAC